MKYKVEYAFPVEDFLRRLPPEPKTLYYPPPLSSESGLSLLCHRAIEARPSESMGQIAETNVPIGIHRCADLNPVQQV